MSQKDVVICSAARTPIGSFQGVLSPLSASDLGAVVVREAIKRAAAKPDHVERVFMGNVLSAGMGQAPARQCVIKADLPVSTGAITLNKVCGSGLQAVMFARREILVGDADVIVAGGMESMTNAPYIMPQARSGYRMGNGQILDSMIHDGLWDPYDNVHMGVCGDAVAAKYKFTREDQDKFAADSYRRALAAQKEGRFKQEIVPVSVPQKRGEPLLVDADEEPGRGNIEKLPGLRSSFQKDGTITAGNASSLNDGGAAVVLMSADEAKRRGAPVLARIVASGYHAQAPEWFTTAPAPAIEKALAKAGWKASQVDLWEINEAFAVVSIANNQLLGVDPAKVNVWGGAVALGHPIGASGARILVTLLGAMLDGSAKRGLATLCIGGGEAVAVVVERC
jgi:acetyl-CoA C-acetyltransferase